VSFIQLSYFLNVILIDLLKVRNKSTETSEFRLQYCWWICCSGRRDVWSSVALQCLCWPFYSKYSLKCIFILFQTFTSVLWFRLAKYLLVCVLVVLRKNPFARLVFDVMATKDRVEQVLYLVCSKPTQRKTTVLLF